MLDDCGCCNVCVRQLNKDCSKTEPCDYVKGLECNMVDDFVQLRASVEPNQTGHLEFMVPKLDCAKPRLVKDTGRCCGQLLCPDEAEEESSAVKKHIIKHGRDRPCEDDLTNNNKLVPERRGGLKSLPAFIGDSTSHMLARGDTCVPQTTAWSSCSKSCGSGVSTRMTNSNTQCKLVKETRICEIHSCNQIDFGRLKNDQKCKHTENASCPLKLFYSGCRSLKKFQPRYCGSCSDGRCCRPHRTKTLPVCFCCKDGETFSRKVMMIQSCKCNVNCSHNDKPPGSQWMFK
ncbi:hypothetical protein LDENG_00289960 [Lucifuga dentata]|nr:hypothetical protein LDENG_00289960 [Lucifuga dentata]